MSSPSPAHEGLLCSHPLRRPVAAMGQVTADTPGLYVAASGLRDPKHPAKNAAVTLSWT
jgi:hypothetical protein